MEELFKCKTVAESRCDTGIIKVIEVKTYIGVAWNAITL